MSWIRPRRTNCRRRCLHVVNCAGVLASHQRSSALAAARLVCTSQRRPHVFVLQGSDWDTRQELLEAGSIRQRLIAVLCQAREARKVLSAMAVLRNL